MSDFLKKYVSVSTLLFILLSFVMPKEGHLWDISCWKTWAVYIFQNGLGNIYHSNSDYLPLYYYLLKLFGLLQGSPEKIGTNIHYLKSMTLIFHFISGFYLVLIIRKDSQSWDKMWVPALFYILNIAVLYNTVVWGQVDEIMTTIVLISCFFAYKQKVTLSLIFITLAINFKLQAIIFLPVVGLILLPVIINVFSVKRMLQWLLIPLFIQVMIILPFFISGTLGNLWSVVTGSVRKYPVISMNAYNIWDLLVRGDLSTIPDNVTFLGITYKNWGLFLFLAAGCIALLPIGRSVYKSIVNRTAFHITLEKLLIICAIIPLLFFYFNTQMHERYSHPAFVFLIAYSLYNNKPFLSILGCSAYLLNLEGVLKYLHLPNYNTLVFNRVLISMMYLFTLIWLYAELFWRKRQKEQVIPVGTKVG
jgi:Gpi18-like mannosyltransferase